jgi:type VI protein secretion system component Hcp
VSRQELAMSLDIFLKVDGIAGESRDRAHADEIDVLSF